MLVTSNRAIRFFEFLFRMNVRAITIFPFIIVSKSSRVDPVLINHEKIHLRQQLEMLILPFYICYLIAFFRKGYLNISFEREAFLHERDLHYLATRKPYSFRRYL